MVAPVIGKGQQEVVDVVVFHPAFERLHQTRLAVSAQVGDAESVSLVNPPPAIYVKLQTNVQGGHAEINTGQQAA